MTRTLVAGVDSSTQSCKVVVRDADTGELVREGRAPHPDGTEVAPDAWRDALQRAVAGGLLDGVAALSVGAQQHGMVALDEQGEVVRDALLWNDTRSAQAARDLTDELGGPGSWVHAVGAAPVASLTVSKLRWLAEHEPENAGRTRSVVLPHDWLSWQLAGRAGAPVTDRGDASGTGYWSPTTGAYREDLLERALGKRVALPRVAGPAEQVGRTAGGVPGVPDGVVLGAGTGDNMAAALALDAAPGDVVLSIGTSGVASCVTDQPVLDQHGVVTGFADATGRFLPLACTLNAGRVLDAAARLLGVPLARLDELALAEPAGAGGLVLLPYLEGERTPDRPGARGVLAGLSLETATPGSLARAAVEALLCSLADAVDALRRAGAHVERILLVGGGARSAAVQALAPALLQLPVLVPEPGEYVADGAARQAAWALSGSDTPPDWGARRRVRALPEAPHTPHVRARYDALRDATAEEPWSSGSL